MKLFYSQNSPYARVARIAALESSLSDDVEHVQVVNRTLDNPLRAISPTWRVPTLVHGDLVLGESRHICAYLDDLQKCAQFFPAGPTDWRMIGIESTVLAFLDSIVAQVSETRRPANSYSDKRIGYEREKTRNSLAHFDQSIGTDPDHFDDWNFASISLAAALSLMEFHDFAPDWKGRCSGLAHWLEKNIARSSMVATAPA